MKIVTFLLAEAANYTKDNKANLLGVGPSIIEAPKIPVAISMSAFLRVRFFLPQDFGEHEFKVDILDVDEKPIMGTHKKQIHVDPEIHDKALYVYHQHIMHGPFIFPQYGQYKFRAQVDNNVEKEAFIPFTILKKPQ